MAGAIAGTAILKNFNPSNKLKTITLTINNSCNLTCPHCYLQYEKKSFLIQDSTINSIFNSDFEHLAIVGKEPLVNRSSILLLEQLIEKCYLNNKTISIITNGIGLGNLKTTVANYLDYIDVSFDGGPDTYELYRKASFKKIINNINELQIKCKVRFNALHTLSSGNVDNIDDMIAIKQFGKFEIIMFSPYLLTEHDGTNKVSFVQLSEILRKLQHSKLFISTSEAFLLLDTYHLEQQGVSNEVIIDLISSYHLNKKIRLITKDPLQYGIIRVTYDDHVLTPYESIHPRYYNKSHYLASNRNLNTIFEEMQNSFEYAS